ncbi:MAG: hypothetical protein ACTSW1_08800 [Candidatus Hodarchaeales archaeon]
MAQGVKSKYIKSILQSLQNGPKTFTELKQLTGITERTLSRYLTEHLEPWGAIEKNKDDKWATKIYEKKYDSYSQHRWLLSHSESLLKGLDILLYNLKNEYRKNIVKLHEEMFTNDKKRLNRQEVTEIIGDTPLNGLVEPSQYDDKFKDLFNEHLKSGYPELYTLIEENDAYRIKAPDVVNAAVEIIDSKLDGDKQTYRKLVDQILDEYPDLFPKNGNFEYAEFHNIPFGFDPKFNFAALLYSQLKKELNYNPNLKKIPVDTNIRSLKIGNLSINSLNPNLKKNIVKAINELNEIEYLDKVRNMIVTENEYIAKKNELLSRLLEIKAKVVTGSPLDGVCSGCRGVIIKEAV